MRRSSSPKQLALVGSVLVAAIILAAVLVIRMQHDEAIAVYRKGVANLGRGLAQQTIYWLATTDKALSGIQTELSPMLEAAPEGLGAALRSKAAFDILARRQSDLMSVDALELVDAAGRIVNSSRDGMSLSLDVSGEDFFRHFAGGPDSTATFVGTPTQSRFNDQPVFLIARRLNGPGGAFAGVALAAITLKDLRDFFGLVMPPERSVTLLREDGTAIVRVPAPGPEAGKPVPPASGWHAIVERGAPGVYESFDPIEGAPVIAWVHPLRILPLVVQASVPEGVALASWLEGCPWVAAGALAAASGVVLLLRGLSKQVRRLERSELSLASRNRQLEYARRQFDIALSNITQGVCFFDRDRRLVVCNGRYGEIYRLPPEAVRPGASLAEIIGARLTAGTISRPTFDTVLADSYARIEASLPSKTTVELTDGRTVEINVRPMPGGGWVATHEDITQRRDAEEKVAFLARHDILTSLANRALFHERIEMALAGTRRGSAFAVLFLDLDRFKLVNDTLGHQVGDELLRGVADRLKACAREIDTVARLGGDEFVILQAGLNRPLDAAALAERILASFKEPFRIAGHELLAATSIGIAVAPSDGTTADTLLKNADTALYMAKREGRDTFQFFEPEMDALIQNRHGLERDLREAASRGELDIHYQPLVDLKSGRVRAFEALLRWNHPERGLIGPDEFIPIAEESRLILGIGEWVLRQACRRATEWPGEIGVAVNLSPVQFCFGDLAATVADALSASRLPASRLELEITETTLLQDTGATRAALRDLRALGVSISMDDFGTGYSSLSYLRQFPFDRVKIDRSFIKDVDKRDDVRFIVRAILGLCRNLGIATTAEGVETSDQLATLLAEDCDEVQGYLFSQPLPQERLAPLLGGAPLLSPQMREEAGRTVGVA